MAALLFLPALGVGLTADDTWWALALPGRPGAAPFDMDFGLAGDFWARRGAGAWWADPGFRWTLARPLSVWLFRAFYGVFGASAVAWQALSIAAYLGVLAALWPLLRRLGEPGLARLALLLFAAHPAHVQLVWFASNGHALFAAIPTLLALNAWIRWREEGWAPGAGLAAPGLGLGLGFSDAALGGIALFLAYEAVSRRWVASALGLGLLAAFAGVHGELGFGVQGSALYIDPRAAPLRLLAAAPERLAVALSGALGVLPADLWLVAPPLRPGLVLAGIAGAILLGAGLRGAWPGLGASGRRWIATLGLGGLLGMPIFLGAPPGGRLLLWASIGASAAAAGVIRAGPRWARGLLGGAALLGGLSIPIQLQGVRGRAEALREAARASEIGPQRRALVLAMPDALTAQYLLAARLLETGEAPPAAWVVLSMAPADVRVERPEPDTLLVDLKEGAMWTGSFERLFLADAGLARPGQRFRGPEVEAEILAVNADGPSRVAFRFASPLEGWRALTWRDGALRAVALPPVGGALQLAWSPSPFPAAR